MQVSRRWKKMEPKIQTLENATAAKPRGGAPYSGHMVYRVAFFLQTGNLESS